MAFAVAVDNSGLSEDGSVRKIAWTAGATGDAGGGVQLGPCADACVQITGTIGGATVTIEGSNDSTDGSDGTWMTLNDKQGSALSFTALTASLKALAELPRWVRPKVTGGAASAIAVTLILRRRNSMRT